MRLSGLHDFLLRKWGFDELYDALFVRPALALGVVSARFDKRVLPGEQAHAGDRSINLTSLDGALSAIGQGMFLLGRRVRSFQGGRIRRYVTVAILLAIVLLGALSVLTP